MLLNLLLLKMSLDDLKTQHIDLCDVFIVSIFIFSQWTPIFLMLGYILKRYWGEGDVFLFSLMCTCPSIYIDRFLILAGIMGLCTHKIFKKRIIPFVPILSLSFYLSQF